MNTIYTYGYTGSTPADLLAHVERLGAILLDIRYQAWSRRPEWTSDAIRKLVGLGRYMHLRTLGNVNYKNGGPIELADPDLALYYLRPMLRHRPIILLCACANPTTCHRSVAADYIAERTGAPVEHLPARIAPPNSMKALSLTQPWVSLVAIGAKQYETRSWATKYRGPLAIHAAKGFPKDAQELCIYEPFGSVLAAAGCSSIGQLPLGAIIATCRLVDCVPTESIVDDISDNEYEFGNWSDGRFAWKLKDVKILAEPIPAKGALQLWDWTPPEGVLP